MKQQFLADGHCDFIDQDRNRAANYLKDIVYNAVGDVVVKAREYMDWLRETAKIAGLKNKGIWWTTYDGLPVLQAYIQPNSKQVVTVHGRLILYECPDDPSKREVSVHKQMRGLPPNFVHAADGCHMRMTVNGLLDEGVTSFCCVHDSYGVHACHVTQMHRVLRDKFIEMHKSNIIEQFRKQVEEQIGEKLPDPPEKGDLDLEQIRDSKYFFH